MFSRTSSPCSAQTYRLRCAKLNHRISLNNYLAIADKYQQHYFKFYIQPNDVTTQLKRFYISYNLEIYLAEGIENYASARSPNLTSARVTLTFDLLSLRYTTVKCA